MDHLLSKDMPVEVIQQGMVGQDLYLDNFYTNKSLSFETRCVRLLLKDIYNNQIQLLID